jgi:hypothetical protein
MTSTVFPTGPEIYSQRQILEFGGGEQLFSPSISPPTKNAARRNKRPPNAGGLP